MTGLRGPATARGSTGLLLSAALLGVISMGLPWTLGRGGFYLPGAYVAGGCTTHTELDGSLSLDCLPGTIIPGYYTGGVPALPGYATDIRVWFVLAVALVWYGVRNGSRRLQLIGAGVAALGWAVQLGSQSGQLTYLLALVLLLAVVLGRDTPAADPPG